MHVIKNTKNQHICSPGGDSRLFDSKEEAKGFILDKIQANPKWANKKIRIEPYLPNFMHLDGLEYLRDIGFILNKQTDGDHLLVECETLLNAPMTDALMNVISGVHKLNYCHDFRVEFGSPITHTSYMDVTLEFPVYFVPKRGNKYKPSEWRKKFYE
jgi:hypothetical protein